MKNILAIFILSYSLTSAGQSKRDYNWILGYPSGESPNWSRLLMNFDDHKRTITRFDEGHEDIFFNNASISNPEGELLFYTNGCTVYDSTFQVMMNGDSLNNNEWYDFFCDESANGLQNTMILPDPGYEDGYYILHQPLFFFENPVTFQTVRLLYSYVDMNLNGGKGEVTQKNVEYKSGTRIGTGFFSACLHENGRDWWFIKNKFDSDIKYIYGLDENGIYLSDSIAIGDTITKEVSGGGQAKFSSDGSKYITHSQYNGLNIYDFDRASGQLSNHERYYLQDKVVDLSGVEISPSGQFCYISFPLALYQMDLWAEDKEESVVLIDTLDLTIMEPFIMPFTISQLGPDCKIYITSGSTVRGLHVINKPDEKGLACDFVQRGVKLEVTHARNSLPHFPHFRIDEADICDPTITNVFGLPVVEAMPITISPNPAISTIAITTEGLENAKYTILDNNGQIILQGEWTRDTRNIDISELVSGVYYLKMQNKNKIGVEQFVKIRGG